MKNFSSQKGQMLLIVVLTMVVVLTIGLSVASRSITNMKISKQNEESQRAFQAAEAGIEQALKKGGDALISDLGNNANFKANVKSTSGQAVALNGGDDVSQTKGVDVWLSTYPNFGTPRISDTLSIFWGSQDQDVASGCSSSITDKSKIVPALEIVALFGSNPQSPSFVRYLYDPCGGGVRIPSLSPQGVVAGLYNIAGNDFKYRVVLPPIADGLIMKIIPIFNSSKVALTSYSSSLPDQGKMVESLGTSGETQRKIIYYESLPQLPIEIFPYAILSQ